MQNLIIPACVTAVGSLKTIINVFITVVPSDITCHHDAAVLMILYHYATGNRSSLRPNERTLREREREREKERKVFNLKDEHWKCPHRSAALWRPCPSSRLG
jgi:hypothetical protein